MICRFPEPGHGRNGKGTTALYSPWPQSQERNPLSSEGIHTVFSVDDSLYLRWQADLLAHTHKKAGQPGPITRLWSAYGRPFPFAGRTFRTGSYSRHPISGDYYPIYNKVMALKAWLQGSPPAEESVLLLDPDCVFLAPLTGSVERGHPVSQPVSYMDPAHNQELVEKHCLRPELVDAVGIPTLIHRDDLVILAPLWVKKLEEIRNDPRSRELAGWVSEMWAYTFSAAELGLRHALPELAHFQAENRADLPIVHYCYSSSDPEKRWVWDKRTYRPWERVPDPPSEIPQASKALIGLLNEYASMPKHEICLY